MSLINLSQIHRGSRLSFSNVKKYNMETFYLSETATTEFIINNKPPGTYFTSLYHNFDNELTYVEIEINHNIYYQYEDFKFDKSTGKITWTNTAEKNGFDLTSDISDYIRVKYAYTYEKATNRFVFNKNKESFMELEVNEMIYSIHEKKNPLFFFEEGVSFGIPYDSSTPVIIDESLFDGVGLDNFFWGTKLKMIREKNNTGVIFSGASNILPGDTSDTSQGIVYTTSYIESTVNNGSFNDLKTAYNNDENIILEFIKD